MNLILFGFKAAGKTHFGKLLSKELKRPFIDTDDLITQLYAKQFKNELPIRQIHQTLSDTGFRILEKAAIFKLKPNAQAIIALGGGAILDPENLDYLKKIGQLVYLKVGFDSLKKRILNYDLPAFIDAENPEESLRKIYEQRLPIYESIPAICIQVDHLSEEECLAKLRSIALDTGGV
jgi:shikimate kinase